MFVFEKSGGERIHLFNCMKKKERNNCHVWSARDVVLYYFSLELTFVLPLTACDFCTCLNYGVIIITEVEACMMMIIMLVILRDWNSNDLFLA